MNIFTFTKIRRSKFNLNRNRSEGNCHNKIGVTCVNGQMLLEAAKRRITNDDLVAKMKEDTKKSKSDKVKASALNAYSKWVRGGRKNDNDNNPDILASEVNHISMFDIPRISTEKHPQYNTGTKVKD